MYTFICIGVEILESEVHFGLSKMRETWGKKHSPYVCFNRLFLLHWILKWKMRSCWRHTLLLPNPPSKALPVLWSPWFRKHLYWPWPQQIQIVPSLYALQINNDCYLLPNFYQKQNAGYVFQDFILRFVAYYEPIFHIPLIKCFFLDWR